MIPQVVFLNFRGFPSLFAEVSSIDRLPGRKAADIQSELGRPRALSLSLSQSLTRLRFEPRGGHSTRRRRTRTYSTSSTASAAAAARGAAAAPRPRAADTYRRWQAGLLSFVAMPILLYWSPRIHSICTACSCHFQVSKFLKVICHSSQYSTR